MFPCIHCGKIVFSGKILFIFKHHKQIVNKQYFSLHKHFEYTIIYISIL